MNLFAINRLGHLRVCAFAFFALCFALYLLCGLMACSDSGSDEVAGGVTDIGNSIAYAGSVIDGSDKPVANARVVAYYDGWGQTEIRDSVETETDENGTFELKVDSGANFVLYASRGDECGLSKVDSTAESQHITIGGAKNLKGSMYGKSSGYMRVVGSGRTAKLSKDGNFEFTELPPGDISLVFVEEGESMARLEFSTVDDVDSLEIPALRNEDEGDWLFITDSRYYKDAPYGGLNVQMPESVHELPSFVTSLPVTVQLPGVNESLDGIVVPVRIPTEGFEKGMIGVEDAKGEPVAFEVDYWDDDETVLWVRLDSVAKKTKEVALNVVVKATDNLSVFSADKNVMGALHLNGDAKVLNHDFSEARAVSDSVGFIGRGITLKMGQFIDMNYLDPCGGDFTLSLWTKWNGPNTRHQVLFSQREYWSDSTSRFQWHFEANSELFTVMKSMPNYPEAVFFGDSLAVPVGEWMYLTLVSKDSMVTMYVNGEAIGFEDENGKWVTAQKFVPNDLKQAVPFRIGGDEIDDESWDGALDEIRIETVARSEAWIKTVYETQKAVGKSK